MATSMANKAGERGQRQELGSRTSCEYRQMAIGIRHTEDGVMEDRITS
jgi:hypothetical protein